MDWKSLWIFQMKKNKSNKNKWLGLYNALDNCWWVDSNKFVNLYIFAKIKLKFKSLTIYLYCIKRALVKRKFNLKFSY